MDQWLGVWTAAQLTVYGTNRDSGYLCQSHRQPMERLVTCLTAAPSRQRMLDPHFQDRWGSQQSYIYCLSYYWSDNPFIYTGWHRKWSSYGLLPLLYQSSFDLTHWLLGDHCLTTVFSTRLTDRTSLATSLSLITLFYILKQIWHWTEGREGKLGETQIRPFFLPYWPYVCRELL